MTFYNFKNTWHYDEFTFLHDLIIEKPNLLFVDIDKGMFCGVT